MVGKQMGRERHNGGSCNLSQDRGGSKFSEVRGTTIGQHTLEVGDNLEAEDEGKDEREGEHCVLVRL